MAGPRLEDISITIGAARAGLRKLIDQIHDYHQHLATLPCKYLEKSDVALHADHIYQLSVT